MHLPVLLEETIESLAIKPSGIYLDGTLGSAGHSKEILKGLNNGFLVGIDRDEAALGRAAENLKDFEGKFRLLHGNYGDCEDLVKQTGLNAFDGILLDIGVSSNQLDEAERGFSFMRSGPLDMRMDRTQTLSAKEVVNTYSQEELANVIFRFGEERASRRIASAIVRERAKSEISTTERLAELVDKTLGGRKGSKTHPATKTFQALRMEVNGELDALSNGLIGALNLLKPGGRLAVITFHSLEDRLVKNFFREHVGREVALQAGGSRWQGLTPRVNFINKKPITARAKELEENPRARSAKLRVVEMR
ncbi:MAG: 16S rRNA (cytosine(1402)-N(4))-methyltransferase RsmH [Kiritimatiellae bacterium]|jgi:16S rRNA (cytosine1402-N4)-methyltransferase|nr:16S rRNA (cytosine(1402)-N(4))-methyltransferase RsmH [Kiritimatiellia bacterium]